MSVARVVVALAVTLGLITSGQPATAEDPTTTTTTLQATSTSTTAPTTSTSTTLPGASAPGGEAPVDRSELEQLLRGYDEAIAFEAELLARYEVSVTELDGLNTRMVELTRSIAEVENELLEAQTEVVSAESRVHIADVRLGEVEEELAETRRRLEEQAVDAYVYGGDLPASLAAAAASGPNEVETSREYAEAVVEHTDSVADEYLVLRGQASELLYEAESARGEAELARDEVEERRDQLEEERLDQARAQADVFVAALGQQELIEEIRAQQGAYELRLRTLGTSSDSISGLLQERQREQELPEAMEGIFLPPIPDAPVVSPFGPRLHPIFGTVRMHNGTDFDADAGTPIRAAEAGEVVLAEWREGYGLTTVIDHGNGLATLYAHQSALVAQSGEPVRMGEVIGLVGSTGWSTGPHLHWEVRVFGNPVDPITYLGPESLLDGG